LTERDSRFLTPPLRGSVKKRLSSKRSLFAVRVFDIGRACGSAWDADRRAAYQ